MRKDAAPKLSPEAAIAELRRIIDELKTELRGLESKIVAEQQRMAGPEARVMRAIRDGNDRLARDSLLDLQGSAESLAALRAEITVVREMITECEAFLVEHANGRA